jgi:hypothetical protein
MREDNSFVRACKFTCSGLDSPKLGHNSVGQVPLTKGTPADESWIAAAATNIAMKAFILKLIARTQSELIK